MNIFQDSKAIFVWLHTDLDGFSVLLASKACLGSKIKNFKAIDYSNVNGEIQKMDYSKYDGVICGDLNVKPETVEFLQELGIPMFFGDHHSSSDAYPKAANIILDKSRSGGLIVWDFLKKQTGFKSEKLDEFFQIVDAGDRYIKDSKYFDISQKLNIIKDLYDENDFVKRFLLWNGSFTEKEEEFYIKETERQNSEISEMEFHREESNGIKWLWVIQKDDKIASGPICEYFNSKFKDLEFIVLVKPTQISFRGIEGKTKINLAELAKKTNPTGGGHFLASGVARSNIDPKNNSAEKIIQTIKEKI